MHDLVEPRILHGLQSARDLFIDLAGPSAANVPGEPDERGERYPGVSSFDGGFHRFPDSLHR